MTEDESLGIEETQLSNTDRLEAHLDSSSLAAAFLAEWIKPGSSEVRRQRLQAVLDQHIEEEASESVPASTE